MKLHFSLHESKIKFKKTKRGVYDVELSYDSNDKVLISVFSHVKDNSEPIHNITQEMTTIDKGWEGHHMCQEGTNKTHKVKGISVDASDSTIFSKDINNQVYPFVVRMVRF